MRQRFYGHDAFDHPAPRFAEYVALLRRAWAATDGLEHDGDFYHAQIAGFRASPELEQWGAPQVYGSGLNATMIRYAAASCDGIALHPLASASHYLDQVALPAMEAGRRGSQVRLAIWVITSIHEERAVAAARVKANLAFYFSTPSYQSVVAGTEWETVAKTVRERFRTIGPRWSQIGESIPQEMCDAFSLYGTPQEVAAALPSMEAALAVRGADEIVFQTVGIGLSDQENIDNCRLIVETVGDD